MKRNIELFIEDIFENICDIESFSKGMTKEEFFNSKLKQKAIIRSLEIIGESVKNIPDFFRDKYPNVPWKIIAGFRDVLIHSYFGVDLDRVWNVIKFDLSALKKEIEKIRF